jgi:hypothetical protein
LINTLMHNAVRRGPFTARSLVHQTAAFFARRSISGSSEDQEAKDGHCSDSWRGRVPAEVEALIESKTKKLTRHATASYAGGGGDGVGTVLQSETELALCALSQYLEESPFDDDDRRARADRTDSTKTVIRSMLRSEQWQQRYLAFFSLQLTPWRHQRALRLRHDRIEASWRV